MTALVPNFSASDRSELRKSQGLTSNQLKRLEGDLGAIYARLGPHVRMPTLRNELRGLAEDLRAAAKRVNGWIAATQPAPGVEALGHLELAANQLEVPVQTLTGGERVTPLIGAAEFIEFLARAAELAVEQAPNKRRGPNPASGPAIKKIWEAITHPQDDQSRKAAEALLPSMYDRPDPNFVRVVEIVFDAVHRAKTTRYGAAATSPLKAEPSIRAYLEENPTAPRRKPGRPRQVR